MRLVLTNNLSTSRSFTVGLVEPWLEDKKLMNLYFNTKHLSVQACDGL